MGTFSLGALLEEAVSNTGWLENTTLLPICNFGNLRKYEQTWKELRILNAALAHLTNRRVVPLCSYSATGVPNSLSPPQCRMCNTRRGGGTADIPMERRTRKASRLPKAVCDMIQ